MPNAKLRAYFRWARAAGPFWQYVTATPFYAELPQQSTSLPISSGQRIVEQSVLPFFNSTPGRVALLLDLPLELGLATTLAFQDAGMLVVPVIHRWPGVWPILPVDIVLAQLKCLSAQLRRQDNPRGIVFVLDAERQAIPHVGAVERQFDNRYFYKEDDFPAAKMLQEWHTEAVAIVANNHALPNDIEWISDCFSRSYLAVSRVWVPLV